MNTITVKTTSEVKVSDGSFVINSFFDENSDGTKNPSIFKSRVLSEKMEIDNVDGDGGDLVMSFGDNADANLSDNGSLNILPNSEDNADNYSKQDENIIYNG